MQVVTARHTEYDGGYVFSLSVHRGGTCSSKFCHQMSYCPVGGGGGVSRVLEFWASGVLGGGGLRSEFWTSGVIAGGGGEGGPRSRFLPGYTPPKKKKKRRRTVLLLLAFCQIFPTKIDFGGVCYKILVAIVLPSLTRVLFESIFSLKRRTFHFCTHWPISNRFRFFFDTFFFSSGIN